MKHIYNILFSQPNQDLNRMIEGIPYPAEDMSMTSYSDMSDNTPARVKQNLGRYLN